MKPNPIQTILFILCLVAVSGIALAYSAKSSSPRSGAGLIPDPGTEIFPNPGVVALSGRLDRDKVLQGSDGRVSLLLEIATKDDSGRSPGNHRSVDMVVVLDRSGSMKGRKLEDAKRAIANLVTVLTPKDRFALVAYSDGVQQLTDLVSVTDGNRAWLIPLIHNIRAGGGTNLGGGLKTGIEMLVGASRKGNTGRVILISDGLANQGVTDPNALGNMAASAVINEFSVSTVGVGTEFNELLMTRIADSGTGNYYFLENPDAFAEVFHQEFIAAKKVAATSVRVQIPISNGITLIDASGYPITTRGGHAVFFPGDLRFGQTRKLFLTLGIPAGRERTVRIDGITLEYMYDGRSYVAGISKPLTVACTTDPKAVSASIDKTTWEEKVLKDEYNRLRQEVAGDIREGSPKKALDRIKFYHRRQEAENAVVGSAKVKESLEKDVAGLEEMVVETFRGAPAAVNQKQKLNAKSLQYEGYKGRRSVEN